MEKTLKSLIVIGYDMVASVQSIMSTVLMAGAAGMSNISKFTKLFWN